ncbi:MAG: RimJ/RimL family protein N-acetyltransferase [Planctomycetota bacterium]
MHTPILPGEHVRLVPLTLAHAAPLYAIARRSGVWDWMPSAMTSPDDMQAYIQQAQKDHAAGGCMPFAIQGANSDQVLGSTRYGNVALEHRRLEIGWTFIDPGTWGTLVNTECKRLLLSYAFGHLECLRVEFKTDSYNARSRAAILRLGAEEEGTLRQHIVCADGRLRDTVYFSILAAEWPDVRNRLDGRLAAE